MRFSDISVLRLWVTGSLVVAAAFAVWTFVPLLIPFGVVVGVLGLMTWSIRALVRYVERRRDG